jgi:hypothetical protein
MKPTSKHFHLNVSALAVAALVSACGGGNNSGDLTPPTLTVTDNVAEAKATGTVTFTFTFSESVGSSFTKEDITVTGGTAGTFTMVDPTHATLVVTPNASTMGTMGVSVPAAKVVDAAGNVNYVAASATQDYNTITGPEVAITDNVEGTLTTGTVTFTFTFSKNIAAGSFTTDDIVVAGGGTKGAFAMVDATHATLVVTPAPSASGTISVNVAVGTFTDETSVANDVAASATQEYDTTGANVSGSTGTCTASPCIDFSSASVGYTAFEGLISAEQAVDPKDPTNMVAKFVKDSTGKPWAGATISTDGGTDKTVAPFGLATSKIVTLRVLSTAVGELTMLKLENAADGSKCLEAGAVSTVAGAWETLTFNFSTNIAGSTCPAFDAATVYNRVSVFPIFLSLPTGSETFYYDELSYTP